MLTTFLLLAFGWSWLAWGIGAVVTPDLTGLTDPRFAPWLLAGSFGPSFAAILVTWRHAGPSGVAHLLRSFLRFRAPPWLDVVVLFTLPTASMRLALALRLTPTIPSWQIALTSIVAAPIHGLLGGVIIGVGPLGEELGWRGWLEAGIGRFKQRMRTALTIGLPWSSWHAPLMVDVGFRLDLPAWQFIPGYTLSLVLASFVMGHAWRTSGGSLSLALLFHGVMNVSSGRFLNAWEHASPLGPMALMLASLSVTALAIEGASRRVRQSGIAGSPAP